MDVLKIDVPRNNLTLRRLDKIRKALAELGVKEGDVITVTETSTRMRFSARTYWGY